MRSGHGERCLRQAQSGTRDALIPKLSEYLFGCKTYISVVYARLHNVSGLHKRFLIYR